MSPHPEHMLPLKARNITVQDSESKGKIIKQEAKLSLG